MSGTDAVWAVRFAHAAMSDFEHILHWTTVRFGEQQAQIDSETLVAALEALDQGPDAIGVKRRPDLGESVFTLHAASVQRRARHLIVFRTETDHGDMAVQVLRILHDAMDIPRHVPTGSS